MPGFTSSHSDMPIETVADATGSPLKRSRGDANDDEDDTGSHWDYGSQGKSLTSRNSMT